MLVSLKLRETFHALSCFMFRFTSEDRYCKNDVDTFLLECNFVFLTERAGVKIAKSERKVNVTESRN